MADFRKWFLVLAVLAVVALPASAQISCTVTPSTPLAIRDGGLTELVGDVVLNCAGNAPVGVTAAYATADFQIFTSPAQITNRLYASTTGAAAAECPLTVNPCVTDALLIPTMVNGAIFPQPVGQAVANYAQPIVGLLQPQTATGDVKNTRNSILFRNVSLPYGTTTQVRITNVRVAAPAASTSLLPTQVFMVLQTNPFGAYPINNPTQTVAYVQPPMLFSTRTCNDAAGAVTTFQQCVTPAAGITFNAKFTEGFALAFKQRVLGTPTAPTQSIAGVAYNTESGLIWPAAVQAVGGTTLALNTTSLADSGTQLTLRFSNVPANVNIAVTNTQTVDGTTGGITAAYVGTAGSGSTACGANTYTTTAVAITNGAGQATWEVTSAAQTTATTQKSISFGVVISYSTSNPPGLTGTTNGSVSGALAPISTIDYAAPSSSTAVIPRFLDRPVNAQVFAIVSCYTNLLFPFVSNQGGFDTGIALVNTSLDNAGSAKPFNTAPQAGACTVYYFNGTSSAPAPQTTSSIAAGAMSTFMLSSGGVSGATSSAVGFQGYIIARCNFQYGHGYAYITDKNVPSTGSAGYLALIIPNYAGDVRPPSINTDSTVRTGEQLNN